MRRAATCRSIQRESRAPLAQEEGRPARRARTPPARAPRRPCSGTGAKLIASTIAATSTIERMPPRLSTGSVVSLTWLGTSRIAITSATTASGSVIRNTEPQAWCSSSAPESSGPSADDRAAEARPQRDRFRAPWTRPQRRDQRERRRVGHAGREPAEDAGADRGPRRWRRTPRGSTRGSPGTCPARASACARSGRRARPR